MKFMKDTAKSIDGLGRAVFPGNELNVGEVQPEQAGSSLAEGWGGILGGCSLEIKSQSSVNQAFMGNQSFSS